MEEAEANKKKWLNIAQNIFWVAYIAIPIFTGILAYQYLPNESPMLADGQVLQPYKILSSHEDCQDNSAGGSNCGTIADAWENTKTGQIFIQANFQNHRISERNSMAVRWFLYGLLGCIFFAGVQFYKKKDFYKYFGMAVAVNLAVTAYIYFSQRTTY